MRSVEAVDPKIVKGSVFRIPAIEGLGSGHGFRITDLALPMGWEKAIPVLQKLDPRNFQEAIREYCEARKLPPGEVAFDPQTGVLTEISIEGSPPATLTLEDEYGKGYSRKGLYSSPQEIPHLTTTIALLKFAGEFVELVDKTIQTPDTHPYIDSEDRGKETIAYYSRNLRLPGKFLDTEEDLFDQDYRYEFDREVKNIAGRFGLSPYISLSFNPRGLLTSLGVLSGNHCRYDLWQWKEPPKNGSYIPTGWVFCPEATTALHGMTALYINTLVEWQERRQKEQPGASLEKYLPRGW